jgi:predicted outer membrane repeat protein
VQADGGGDFVTIQDAIDAVSETDIIELLDGTFRGEGNRDLDFLGKTITIRSQNGDPSLCVIDCESTALEPHRGFHFHSGESEFAVLQGITITNGRVHNPEGLEGGGGVFIDGASPVIVNCVITGNSVTADVGGHSLRGGGVALTGICSPSFVGCTFSDNTTSGGQSYGAGVYCHSGPSAAFTDCTFSGNSGGTFGGGFYGYYSSATFGECVFSGNSAINGGGALLGDPEVNYEFASCTFVRNSANNGGGAFCGNTASFMGCTFALNSGAMYGGGIYCDHMIVDVQLINTVVAFSTVGAGVYVHTEAGQPPTVACCDVFGNDGGEYGGALSDQTGINNNISSDPKFCGAEIDDYRLLDTSPCSSGLSPCGSQIGAHGVGCDSPVEPVSWGSVKARFR